MCGFPNRIGGVMVSVLAASAVNRGFETRSGKTKNYEICICGFWKDVQAASNRMIGLSLEEKVMIKRAMAREFMGSGHWYKCISPLSQQH
jgi:hypothetical protein